MQLSPSPLLWSLSLTRQKPYWCAVFVCVSLGFTLVGCEIGGLSTDDSTGYIDHDVELRLAEENVVSIGSEPPSVPELYFTMRTEENLGCGDFRILHDVERAGDGVLIRALGIKEPKFVSNGPIQTSS